MGTIGFYKYAKDIGNHEAHIQKIGKYFLENCAYRVTSVLGGIAKVEIDNRVEELLPGTMIGVDAIVRTGESYVEIRNSYNQIFRLAPDSEFCLENTIEGIVPVYYGDVQFTSLTTNEVVMSGGKYRTSCWTGPAPTGMASSYNKFTIERINYKEDMYYSFEQPYTVYEYDEIGHKFEIVTLPPYHKCQLTFDFLKPMRERYEVVNISEMKTDDIARLYAKYQQMFASMIELEEKEDVYG
ncbi:hypothetical protein [Dolosigranulum pigrum]|uniref:hypothetical protein n=1 Tax=Dolosigranulum pigrum TaxID=29394 RepID=UPI001AD88445|nr:hypothetical protein [Dolosigranulum pigrum]QTJ32166.1 hypothetical protein FE321_00525 [Dolosigranulum pigrum]